MPKFYCNSETCENKGVEISIPQVKYIYNEERRKVLPDPLVVCEKCGKELVEIKKEGFPQIGKFGSMNDTQKKAVLKERSSNHMKGQAQDLKQHIRKNIIAKNFGGFEQK